MQIKNNIQQNTLSWQETKCYMEEANSSQSPSTWQEAVGQLNDNFSELIKMYSEMLQSVRAIGQSAHDSFGDVYRRINELENSRVNQTNDLKNHFSGLQTNMKALGERLVSTTQIFESYNKMFAVVEKELQSSRSELEAVKEILRKNNLL